MLVACVCMSVSGWCESEGGGWVREREGVVITSGAPCTSTQPTKGRHAEMTHRQNAPIGHDILPSVVEFLPPSSGVSRTWLGSARGMCPSLVWRQVKAPLLSCSSSSLPLSSPACPCLPATSTHAPHQQHTQTHQRTRYTHTGCPISGVLLVWCDIVVSMVCVW